MKIIFLLFILVGGSFPVCSMDKTLTVAVKDNDNKVQRFHDYVGRVPQGVFPLIGALKERKELAAKGVDVPSFIKLLGPHGTGKTTLARAISQELVVPFKKFGVFDIIHASGGDQDSAAVVLHMDEELTRAADQIKAASGDMGVIVYEGLDEIDLDPRIIADLLRKNKSDVHLLFILETTNHRMKIDCMQCFDRLLVTAHPDKKERKELMRYLLECIEMPYEPVSNEIIKETAQASGQCLRGIVHQAAIAAHSEDAECVTNQHLLKNVPDYIKSLNKGEPRQEGPPSSMYG